MESASESDATIRSPPPSSSAIVESIKRRVAPPTSSISVSNPPFFANTFNFSRHLSSSVPNPEQNSSEFPQFSASPFGPFSPARNGSKESPSKEAGLDRKGVRRTPIRMRSRDDFTPASQERQDEVRTTSGGGTTTVLETSGGDERSQLVDESEVQAQPSAEQKTESENPATPASSKIIHYL